MMDKEKFEIQAMDYLSGNMSEKDSVQFEALLKANENYRKEFEVLVDAWAQIEKLDAPEPSTKMDEAFFEILSKETGKNRAGSFWQKSWELILSVWQPKLAYSLLLVGIGLGIGYVLSTNNLFDGKQDLVEVDPETKEVRQRLVLTLLEQPSANQRLQGVSEANKIVKVDSIVVKALLQTLNNDPNVNVRLAAIESLTNYVDDPLVRQGLVQSIGHQESPILQVTLANLMVALQEKASIEPFRQLLKEKALDTTVKKKIKNSIESII